ncbi:type I-B CRISPR-associated protein Cas7/Csh2 [uncultured Methanosphaera sp.]|jgi:CRISPR-associated protein Csh2|uniref:type I-B CRISPR-associated protein Cas7/Csh2 n=1 Tax=Methanosphaera sp. TaxID=2666342 RepID=UPI0025E6D37F|nr:type I-B CRISPR-associated protein Cas7/Csh2 [uncultured Methanosphaera sp.]
MNRSELLFCYDITNGNPNGDPLDDNKPRIDEEGEINIVTDVRLKRTIRDYLADYKDKEIFVQEIVDDEGIVQDAKTRLNDYYNKEYDSLSEFNNDLLSQCIDIRLFGATIPSEIKINKKKVSSIVFTGPVQFRMGKSLNKVELNHIKGTGAFASTTGKTQKTFREEYLLPYSFIGFYGIINEHAAKSTNMTEEDVNLLLDGMWNGTKNLISRSKFGQLPRLLLQIEYNEENFFIGDLDNKIVLKHDLEDDKELRNINELRLDTSMLTDAIIKNKDNIEKVHYKIDDSLEFEGEPLIDVLKENNIEVEEITF